MMKQEELTLVSQRQLAPRIYEMVLTGKMIQEIESPGQFMHLKVNRPDLLLRRPISISSYNKETSEATLIYRTEGEGTKSFCFLKKGDTVDVLGPLGHGFDVSALKAGEVIYLIGGGIGIPPLYEIAKQAQAKGVKVKSFLGYQTKETTYYYDEFKALGDVFATTDDGSFGEIGNPLQFLDQQEEVPDAVYACGPNGLLKAVDKKYLTHPRAFISLESRMACGIGACYACVVQTVEDENKSEKVCEQGPVFETGKVIV